MNDAPRVTPADLEAEIASEHYFTGADGVVGAEYNAEPRHTMGVVPPPQTLSLLTFCVLVLKNGIKVTGESACVSPENFDAEIGRRIARENAVQKLWPLLGFRLADKLTHKPDAVDFDAMCAVQASRIGVERPDLFERIKRALGFTD